MSSTVRSSITGATTNRISFLTSIGRRIQSRLVLEAVVKAEGLTASEEDVNKEISNMAEMYQMEVDKLMELIGEDEKKAMAEDVAVQKALDFVVSAAVEK